MSNPKQQPFDGSPHETEERSIEEGEIVETQSQGSGEESNTDNEGDVARMREVVVAPPATSIRESYVGHGEDKYEDDPKNNAAAAAAIIIAAAAEAKAATKEKGKKAKGKEILSGSGGKSAVRGKQRWRLVVKDSAGAGTSEGGEAKPKKKAPELKNLPAGEPTCPICNRKFASWKAAFGHQRAHKGREHRGFLPIPKFTPPSSPQGQPDDTADAGTSRASGSGRGALGFDLNAPPSEESGSGSRTVADFDLNKTPPNEDADEEQI